MHRTAIGWFIYGGRYCSRAKIFYLSQPGIEPRSLDLQANTLPRRCKAGFYNKLGVFHANQTSMCPDTHLN